MSYPCIIMNPIPDLDLETGDTVMGRDEGPFYFRIEKIRKLGSQEWEIVPIRDREDPLFNTYRIPRLNLGIRRRKVMMYVNGGFGHINMDVPETALSKIQESAKRRGAVIDYQEEYIAWPIGE